MMAPSIVLGRDGSAAARRRQRRLGAAARRDHADRRQRARARACRSTRRSTAPRVHLDEPHVHCEGGHDPAELDRLEALGYDVVRWRRRNLFFGGAAAVEVDARRLARGRRRPAPRRRRASSSAHDGVARPAAAEPRRRRRRSSRSRARSAPSRRAGCSATRAWRSVADERRYIRALRRHPDAALLVAELDGEIVGRLSLARDPHPASAHVADLGLMVAARAPAPRDRHGAARRGRGMGARRRRSASSSCTSSRTTSAAIALYEKLGYVREGYRADALPPPDGRFVDAILMAKQLC